MRVLITGANGQLGCELMAQRDTRMQGHVILGTTRQNMDIRDEKQVKLVLDDFYPDVIIHTAAYTAVDRAETDAVHAYAVNAFGTRNLVAAAERIGAKFVYISTDYVFDGKLRSEAYREYDATAPQSVYGQSKLAGERLTETLSSKYFIVRTSWVYGGHGNNFVKTMLRLGKEQLRLREANEPYKRLKVVADQTGCPTYTADLAGFLWGLARTERYGIYHATNQGSCSWFQFAQAIFEEAGLNVQMDACTTEEFPRPAPRPKYSVLGQMGLLANGFTPLRPWRDALKNFLSTELNVSDET